MNCKEMCKYIEFVADRLLVDLSCEKVCTLWHILRERVTANHIIHFTVL